MSKKGKRQEFADLTLYREMKSIAQMESRAISRRRSADLAKGLTDNEVAQKIREARGTNIPAFSAKGQPKVVATFWKEAKEVRPATLPLPKPKQPIKKIPKAETVYDENGPTFDTGMYDPKTGHPGYTRTA